MLYSMVPSLEFVHNLVVGDTAITILLEALGHTIQTLFTNLGCVGFDLAR